MDFLEKYNIKIINQKLLTTALTHSSYANENNCEDYERLEFLGDAILGTVIASHLYNVSPTGDEGYLTKMRAKIVSR